MKSYRNSFLTALMAVVCFFAMAASSVNAQTTTTTTTTSTTNSGAPKTVPLGSPEQLETYAWSLVNRISGSVSATTLTSSVNQNAFSVGYTPDADYEHMAGVLKSFQFAFKMSPTDTTGHVYYSYDYTFTVNQNGTPVNTECSLFSEDTGFTPQLQKGGYGLPSSAYNVQMTMTDYVPMVFPGLAGAYIQTTDAKGNPTGYYDFSSAGRVDVTDGILWVGVEHTGQVGNLVVNLSNGQNIVYDLVTSKQVQLADLTFGGTALVTTSSMQNSRTLPDNTTSIQYLAGDKLLRVRYSTAALVTIQLPANMSQYPNIYTNTTDGLVAGVPDGVYSSPTTAVSFQVQANEVLVIRFDVPGSGAALPNNEGKGSVDPSSVNHN